MLRGAKGITFGRFVDPIRVTTPRPNLNGWRGLIGWLAATAVMTEFAGDPG